MRAQRRLSRLPHSRGEDAGVVAVGHPRQAGEEILQIDQRVFAVALARDDPGTPPYLAAFTPPQTPYASAPAPHVRRPALSAGGVHLVSPPVTPSQWLPLRHSIRLIPSRLRGPRPAVYRPTLPRPALSGRGRPVAYIGKQVGLHAPAAPWKGHHRPNAKSEEGPCGQVS